jgi:hypothetical protein
MKVKAVDEAKVFIRRRKAFRWMGCRGRVSKSAEGVYGVFVRHSTSGLYQDMETILAAVYEPKTGMWYTTEGYAALIRRMQLDLPDPATKIYWVNASWLIRDIYRSGYPALAHARITGKL